MAETTTGSGKTLKQRILNVWDPVPNSDTRKPTTYHLVWSDDAGPFGRWLAHEYNTPMSDGAAEELARKIGADFMAINSEPHE